MGKYAVIIGINYVKNPEAALQGCCNDARIMNRIVKSKGFEDENIKLIVDDDDECLDPSGPEVKKALEWLCTDREEDDVIFFHFSGHGTQIPCDGDDVEEDMKDEAIVLEQMFLMCDDDLKMFFSKLPQGCKVTCVTDCCHSGSMLDGEEVMIEGAKDDYSSGSTGTSAGLLSILGGCREVEEIEEMSTNRSLPIGTIADVLSRNLGKPVDPTGSGVNGALAEFFGGDAGKLMVKFALARLSGGESSGTDLIKGLAKAFLSGGNKSESASGGGGGGRGLFGALVGGILGGGGGGGGGFSDLLGGLLSGGSGDPMSNLSSELGGMGLGGQESLANTGAPTYKPPSSSTRDVAVLITGCQAHETSADVRPPGGEAFGALTKTLSDVYFANPDISHYDLVSTVRSELSKANFKQNPCLECNSSKASTAFICEA